MIINKPRKKIVIVPDVEAIAREMTTTSQVGIIINRVKALHLTALYKVTVNNIPYLLKIAKKDFAVGIKVLTELEILKLQQTGVVKDIALHQQMVDMAIALKNKKVLEYFLTMSKQYAFTPYLVTANVNLLLKLLSTITSIPKNLVIVNPCDWDPGVVEYKKNSPLNFIDNKGAM